MKSFVSFAIAFVLLATTALPALAQPQQHPMMQGLEIPEKRAVTSSEMGRYLTALEKLVAIGGEAQLEAKPNQQQMAPKYTDAMMRVVKSNGFDETSFTQVHWNVMMGYMAAEMEERQVDIEAAHKMQAAEMAKMKEHMSPEQYEQMMKSMGPMMQLSNMYKDVPPENIALVKKNKAKLDKVLNNEKRK